MLSLNSEIIFRLNCSTGLVQLNFFLFCILFMHVTFIFITILPFIFMSYYVVMTCNQNSNLLLALYRFNSNICNHTKIAYMLVYKDFYFRISMGFMEGVHIF